MVGKHEKPCILPFWSSRIAHNYFIEWINLLYYLFIIVLKGDKEKLALSQEPKTNVCICNMMIIVISLSCNFLEFCLLSNPFHTLQSSSYYLERFYTIALFHRYLLFQLSISFPIFVFKYTICWWNSAMPLQQESILWK